MSFKYLAWAQSFKTGSSSAKAVLMALCSIVNDDGVGFPSQQRIADDTELSIRSVKRAMDDLETRGMLSRERRYRENGYRTSDLITVHQTPIILGAKLSRDTESGDTVSNLRCHSGIAEPVNEPVSNINITREREINSDFLLFKASYPKRAGNADWKSAEKAFNMALKRIDIQTILSKAREYSTWCDFYGKTKTEFVKQARSWLNADGWNETYERTQNGKPKSGYESRKTIGDKWRDGIEEAKAFTTGESVSGDQGLSGTSPLERIYEVD
jgi:hypothetical protein